MNNYETIFIINNDITEEQKKAVISKIENFIKENGKITSTDDMKERRLAYEIRGHKVGYYYVIEFETKSDTITELERLYRITDEVLKFIVVKKND